jgi:hypothetical protein
VKQAFRDVKGTKTTKTKENWIFIDTNKQVLRCDRCGVEVPSPCKEPTDIRYVISCLDAFRKLHRKCKLLEQVKKE